MSHNRIWTGRNEFMILAQGESEGEVAAEFTEAAKTNESAGDNEEGAQEVSEIYMLYATVTTVR